MPPPSAPTPPAPPAPTADEAPGAGPADGPSDGPTDAPDATGTGDAPASATDDSAGDRPSHGHLQIEGGERIALDRPVLFGRRPPDTVTIDDAEARIVTLAGSDALSRSHAQVRFDGDAVQVVDLGSANHTYVTPPGGDPVRLRENEPFTVEPGSVISLADAVRITFEAD